LPVAKYFIAPEAMNRLFDYLVDVYLPCHRNHPLSRAERRANIREL
jgi:hypothetical protein